jgi:hypothetical protein
MQRHDMDVGKVTGGKAELRQYGEAIFAEGCGWTVSQEVGQLPRCYPYLQIVVPQKARRLLAPAMRSKQASTRVGVEPR